MSGAPTIGLTAARRRLWDAVVRLTKSGGGIPPTPAQLQRVMGCPRSNVYFLAERLVRDGWLVPLAGRSGWRAQRGRS